MINSDILYKLNNSNLSFGQKTHILRPECRKLGETYLNICIVFLEYCEDYRKCYLHNIAWAIFVCIAFLWQRSGYVFPIKEILHSLYCSVWHGCQNVAAWPTGFQMVFFFCSGVSKLLAPRDLHRQAAYSICESSFLLHHGSYHHLFVCP